MAREAERAVVFGGGPAVVTKFDFGRQLIIASGLGAGVQPGKDDIHGQIGDALCAQQRLRFFQARGAERPVPRPKFVVFDGEDFRERSRQRFVGDRGLSPGFDAIDQRGFAYPMGGEGKAALGMIGRPQAVEAP